ncbi:nucleotidyltransferase domain-containing protein [Amycolatopsis camponoti]
MPAGTVLRVLDAVHPARVWLAGGWGIDALLGRRTREHRDLDLHPLVFAADGSAVQAAPAGTFPYPAAARPHGHAAPPRSLRRPHPLLAACIEVGQSRSATAARLSSPRRS